MSRKIFVWTKIVLWMFKKKIQPKWKKYVIWANAVYLPTFVRIRNGCFSHTFFAPFVFHMKFALKLENIIHCFSQRDLVCWSSPFCVWNEYWLGSNWTALNLHYIILAVGNIFQNSFCKEMWPIFSWKLGFLSEVAANIWRWKLETTLQWSWRIK